MDLDSCTVLSRHIHDVPDRYNLTRIVDTEAALQNHWEIRGHEGV